MWIAIDMKNEMKTIRETEYTQRDDDNCHHQSHIDTLFRLYGVRSTCTAVVQTHERNSKNEFIDVLLTTTKQTQ